MRGEVWKGTITLSTGLPLSTQGDTAALGGEGLKANGPNAAIVDCEGVRGQRRHGPNLRTEQRMEVDVACACEQNSLDAKPASAGLGLALTKQVEESLLKHKPLPATTATTPSVLHRVPRPPA